jgi:2-phospho-L-lactate guanylyltransferase
VSPDADHHGGWHLVVPVKRLADAKSRVLLAPGERGSLALAMLDDTLAAALPVVTAVAVVTRDPKAAALARAAGADVVDDPSGGLNTAVHAGWRAAASGVRRAALTGDLPALAPSELRSALAAAAEHPYAFVPDRARTGTVLVTSTRTQDRSHFGADSRRAHRRAGAVELAGDWPGLRCDVDTLDDLAVAAALGVGPRTTALLSAAELTRAS